MKTLKLSMLLNTRTGTVIASGAAVLIIELLFMILLNEFLVPTFQLSSVTWGFIDAFVLFMIASPVFYLIFRKVYDNEQRIRLINASAQDAMVIVNEQGRITERGHHP